MYTLTRNYHVREQIADRWVHYAGLLAALVGSVVLIAAAAERESTLLLASVGVYGLALLSMIGASALYNFHFTAPSPRTEWFRRLDRAAIFLMIAGTYTPFALVRMDGVWGLAIAAFIWTAAVAGIVLKLVYPELIERVSIPVYLALGWIGLLAIEPLIDRLPTAALVLLGIGGLLYSLGIVFHLWHRLPYHNAVWHGFVVSAAACHWVAVLDGVVRAA
jgi:hemolysin III